MRNIERFIFSIDSLIEEISLSSFPTEIPPHGAGYLDAGIAPGILISRQIAALKYLLENDHTVVRAQYEISEDALILGLSLPVKAGKHSLNGTEFKAVSVGTIILLLFESEHRLGMHFQALIPSDAKLAWFAYDSISKNIIMDFEHDSFMACCQSCKPYIRLNSSNGMLDEETFNLLMSTQVPEGQKKNRSQEITFLARKHAICSIMKIGQVMFPPFPMVWYPDRIEPTIKGGISLVYRHNGLSLRIKCYNNGDIVGKVNDDKKEETVFSESVKDMDFSKLVEVFYR